MSRGARLLPNLGAEEGGNGSKALRHPRARATAQLWRGLFDPDSSLLADAGPAIPWPEEFGPTARGPAFSWLEDGGAGLPWLATEAALAAPRLAPISASCPNPEVVHHVHDKAFAHREAERAGLVPRPLRGLITVLEAHELEDAEFATRYIDENVAGWPDWTRRRFTLKPRQGCSGRGRVPGQDCCADSPGLREGLAGLAQRGGAILEPWLERGEDLSAQLRIAADGEILLLGTLRQVLSPAGVPVGHRGSVDSRGRVFSESPYEEELREAGAALANAARDAGYHGVCGVDAFSFRADNGRMALRAVVEFNARYTMGTIVLGLLRRVLPLLKNRLRLEPGNRRAFYFGLTAPREGWLAARGRAGDEAVVVPLWIADGGDDLTRPALLLARSEDAISAALG